MTAAYRASVHRAGGLENWVTANSSFTRNQARAIVEKLAEAGAEDEVVALIEAAYEAGWDDGGEAAIEKERA